ncbi:VOC family protein [Streptomyces aureoversilis]|uniref:VOC family protein n=1 Tax=Streptomyces aureoversilis TaxID=67277 RepID=A0ABV9ZS96_9ACTN
MAKANPCNLVDITVPQVAHSEAQKFYTETFGWCVDIDIPGYPIMGTGDGGAQVGLMWEGNPDSGDLAKFWKTGKAMPFLGTDDINATIAAVEGNGGKVLTPKRQKGPVSVAVVQDPWENQWFLWQFGG